MDNYVNKMLDAALNRNKKSFYNTFKDAIVDKIDTQIQSKRDDVSFGAMAFQGKSSVKEDMVYESIKPSNYHFKSSSDAKKFVAAISKMGVTKKQIQIHKDTVSIGGLDKDTNELVSHLSKDMKAVREDISFSSVVGGVMENQVERELLLQDGNIVILDENDAYLLVRLHNFLHNNNKSNMENNIFESQEVYENILNFAKENENDF